MVVDFMLARVAATIMAYSETTEGIRLQVSFSVETELIYACRSSKKLVDRVLGFLTSELGLGPCS